MFVHKDEDWSSDSPNPHKSCKYREARYSSGFPELGRQAETGIPRASWIARVAESLTSELSERHCLGQ